MFISILFFAFGTVAAHASLNVDIGGIEPSPTSIFINEERTDIAAYLVDNNHYFMLREIGKALDIGIEWDEKSRSIRIDTAKPYALERDAYGVETSGSGEIIINGQAVYLNGERVDLDTYLVYGNNYIRLRDIGRALDIGTDWDEITRSVLIDTSKPYTPGTDYTGPDIPPRERAGDEFFADACFIGNSLVDGLKLFSGLKTCDFYAVTSLSVFTAGTSHAIRLDGGGMGTVFQAAAQRDYGKIYILFGINEIGYDTSFFRDMYASMVDKLAAIHPAADIYIMSLSPVSAVKSNTSPVFTMARVREYNAALYELAAEKECYYVDLVDALADGTGYLPENETWDGVHLTVGYYKVWTEYLRTRYR